MAERVDMYESSAPAPVRGVPWLTSIEVDLLFSYPLHPKVSRGYRVQFFVRDVDGPVYARLAPTYEQIASTIEEGVRRLREGICSDWPEYV